MADTGAPHFIPYVEPTDLVRDYPAADEAQAEAVADALDVAGFQQSVTLTSSTSSFTIPVAARKPGVRVTVIGGGGAGGGLGADGGAGGTSTFSASGITAVSAAGGRGGTRPLSGNQTGTGRAGFGSYNGGDGSQDITANTTRIGKDGGGGQVVVAYRNLTGITTASVTIGGGGSPAGSNTFRGAAGGRGEIILEF